MRPPENAGSSDAFRRMDRTTMQMSPEQIAERNRTKQTYVAAVHDWALKGSASEFAYDAASAPRPAAAPDDAAARAHAHFRLAQTLLKHAKREEAAMHFAEASRLHPDSWTIWRQAAEKNVAGLAASPEFWARVDSSATAPTIVPLI